MPAHRWRSAALLSLLAVPASAQVPDGLLGRWAFERVEGTDTPDDAMPGLSPYMAFHEAGVLEIGVAATHGSPGDAAGRAYSQDGQYRVSADTLFVDCAGEQVAQTFRLDGDVLVLDDPDLGITTYLRRASGPVADRQAAIAPASEPFQMPEGLAGRWEVRHVEDAGDSGVADVVAVSFFSDETVGFEFGLDAPDAPEPVAFRIADGRLFLDLGDEIEYGELRLDGDAMTLRDRATGSTLHLRRVPE